MQILVGGVGGGGGGGGADGNSRIFNASFTELAERCSDRAFMTRLLLTI